MRSHSATPEPKPVLEPAQGQALGPSTRVLRVAWTPAAEPCLSAPDTSLWESWSAALDELISDPHDEAAHQRLLFYSRAQGTWGTYNLNLVRQRFTNLEQPDWYRGAVDIQVVWAVNQAVAFAPYDPAARRALSALQVQLARHPQLARDVANNFPGTLAGRKAASLGSPESPPPGPEYDEARALAGLVTRSFPAASRQSPSGALAPADVPPGRRQVDLTPQRGIILAALEFYVEGMRSRALEDPPGATHFYDCANLAEQARLALDEQRIGTLTGSLPIPRPSADSIGAGPARSTPPPSPPGGTAIEP